MTLQKYEYLLRDIPFELYTDNENLVYLNIPPSNKVLRWKLAIQEYDFTISHIAGELNVVADGFSRLTAEIPQSYVSWPSTEMSDIPHRETKASRGHVGNHGTKPQLQAEPTPGQTITRYAESPTRRQLEVKMATKSTHAEYECVSALPSNPVSDQDTTDALGLNCSTRALLQSNLIDVTVPANSVRTPVEYIVVKKARGPVGENIPTTVSTTVWDPAEILHSSQHPLRRKIHNPQCYLTVQHRRQRIFNRLNRAA